jgi:L-amino acid N-acyltransferase YncA
MRISVRPATEDDAEAIVALLNPIIAAGTLTIIDEPLGPDAERRFIRSLPDAAVFNLAIDDDTRSVIGLQDVQPIFPRIRQFRHVGEIATFVALSLRRRGIGAALSRATLAAASGLGYRKVVATISADNPDAQAFYAGQGFRVVGKAERHALVRGQYVDEILAERWLS